MPKIVFTANIQRLVEFPDMQVAGHDVRTSLENAFQANPQARGYILDDQSALRKHIAVFVNRILVRDRKSLSDPVAEADTIFVMQALSGG